MKNILLVSFIVFTFAYMFVVVFDKHNSIKN